MSNTVFIPYLQEIPEWKDCYYDYSAMKMMLEFIVQCQKVNRALSKKIGIQPRTEVGLLNSYYPSMRSLRRIYQPRTHNAIQSTFQLILQENNQIKNGIFVQAKLEARKILQQWMHLLLIYSDQEAAVSYLFVQYKSFQIGDKVQQYQKLLKIVKGDSQQTKNMELLTSNLFVESYYLQKAITFNMSQQKMVQYSLAQQIQDQQQLLQFLHSNVRLKRMDQKNKDILNSIVFKVGAYKHLGSHSDPDFEVIHDKAQIYEARNSHNISLAIGAIMGTVIVIITAIGLNLMISGISIENNAIFRNHFPVWRGASYIVLYLWLLGMDFAFYQANQINYHLIFHYQDFDMPNSKYIFLRASVFSCLYIGLFLIFNFELTGEITSKFYYYGEIFWAIILAYFFLPNPFKRSKKKFEFLSLLGKMFISPCGTLNFLLTWVAEQLISFNQPMGDLFYTICFVSSKDASWCVKQTPNFSSAYIFFIYIFRISQAAKIFYVTKKANPTKKFDFMDLLFLGSVRGFLGIFTAVTALLSRLKVFNGAFTVWVVIAAITTLFSWFTDVKGDWGLFDYRKKKILRQKLLLPNALPFYYFIMLLDLALRTAWILSISPFVLNSTGISQYLFVMMVSYFEILRRAVWNLFKVSFEHTKNMTEFQVTIKDTHILKQVRQKAKQIQMQKLTGRQYFGSSAMLNKQPEFPLFQNLVSKKQEEDMKEMQKVRTQKQLELLKQKLKQRKRLKQQILKVKAKCEQNLNIIQKISQLQPIESIQINTQLFLL